MLDTDIQESIRYGHELDTFREKVWELVNQTYSLSPDSKASILLEIEEELNERNEREEDLLFTNQIREKEDKEMLGRATL